MGDLMRKPYDYLADVAKLKMPVMLVFADSDMYRPEHEIKFYQLLGGGLRDAGWMRETMSQNRLAIIPNRTHYDFFLRHELAEAVMPFLDGQDKVKDLGRSGECGQLISWHLAGQGSFVSVRPIFRRQFIQRGSRSGCQKHKLYSCRTAGDSLW